MKTRKWRIGFAAALAGLLAAGAAQAGVDEEFLFASGLVSFEPSFPDFAQKVVDAVLARYGLKDVRVQIQDQGALEATLNARIETALDRALGKEGPR